MKKNNQIKGLLLLLISAFFMSSCSNDDNTKNENHGTTTGDYLPMKENNKWWYIDNDDVVKLIAISTINYFDNVPYYRIFNSISDLESWVTKKGASYFQKNEQVFLNLNNGNTLYIGQYEIKLLKDDVEVGGTWSEDLTLDVKLHNGGTPISLPATLSYTGTITEKNSTETIEGTTYSNIIKMQMTIIQTVNSQTTTIEAEYWFAKDIGLIKEIVTSSTDNITKISYLTSYELN